MSSLISADNTWVLWGLLVGDAALAIWLEQKYKWAGKVTGCVIALIQNYRMCPGSAGYDDSFQRRDHPNRISCL